MPTLHEDTIRENERLRKVVDLLIEELDDPCRRMPLCTWDGFSHQWVQDKTTHTVHLSLALDKMARAAVT